MPVVIEMEVDFTWASEARKGNRTIEKVDRWLYCQKQAAQLAYMKSAILAGVGEADL